MSPNFLKPERIFLRNHPDYREKWLQEKIAADPTLLGLGDLILKDKERIQPRAGRLDLLLQDPDSATRYEVEIQLGSTDESHIIRTIEYWDIERNRYKNYEHIAVIVAEDITNRFLNVIRLFGGSIPLIAIQLALWKSGEDVFLTPTKVLDTATLVTAAEDEEDEVPTDRTYWENQMGTKSTVALVDQMLVLIKKFAPDLQLKYNKFYIGLAKDGQPDNRVLFKARKSYLLAEIRLPVSPEFEQQLQAAGIDSEYMKRLERYRLRLMPQDIQKNCDLLTSIMKQSYGVDSESMVTTA